MYASAKTCNVTSPRLEVAITVYACTGISETANAESQVQVYPNPGNGMYCIENPETVSVKIISATGQLLREQNLPGGKNYLTLENYPDGIYLVQLKGKYTFKTIKLIKQ